MAEQRFESQIDSTGLTVHSDKETQYEMLQVILQTSQSQNRQPAGRHDIGSFFFLIWYVIFYKSYTIYQLYKITFHFQKGLPLCQEMEKGNKARPLKAIPFKMHLLYFQRGPRLAKSEPKIAVDNMVCMGLFIKDIGNFL